MSVLGLWNQGVSLEQALRLYGSAEKWQEYEKNQELGKDPHKFLIDSSRNSETGEPSEQLTSPSAMNNPVLQGFIIAAKSIVHFLGRHDIERDVTNQLYSGQIIGIGYQFPRKVTDIPVLIPAEVWNGKVKWASSEVEGAGMAFANIRILSAEQFSIQAPHEETPHSQKTARPGRPGVEAQIITAFSELLNAGEINPCEKKTQAYRAIRQWLVRNFPQDSEKFSQLSDKTLQRHTAPLFSKLLKERV